MERLSWCLSSALISLGSGELTAGDFALEEETGVEGAVISDFGRLRYCCTNLIPFGPMRDSSGVERSMEESRDSRTAQRASRCWRCKRFFSRDWCAALRFRRMRSIRRCSFSSCVRARLRGGRVDLKSAGTENAAAVAGTLELVLVLRLPPLLLGRADDDALALRTRFMVLVGCGLVLPFE